MKAKAAEEVGISLNHITFPESATVEEVVSVIKKLNDDASVSGILVQLPLGPHVGPDGERTVTEAVNPDKDVDGSVFCFKLRSALPSDQLIPQASMHTTLGTSPHALPIPCLPRAPRLVSYVYLSPLGSQSKVCVLSFWAGATSLVVLSR